MSSALAKNLASHLEQIVVGPPLFDPSGRVANMVVYPLFPSHLPPDPPELITLSEGMHRGVRLSDTGIVNRVYVDNPLPAALLAGESDLLIGPTQLRVVQFSCLVPPERRVVLPVNCVEEGQPIRYQAEFTRSDACPWHLRSFKMEQLAQHGDPPQYWIWDSIRSYLRTAGAVSTTHDLHAVLDRNSQALRDLSLLFPRQPGQVGAICAVGQNLFLELYGDPEILEDRYPHLLRSALVEALVLGGDQVISSLSIPQFLRQVTEACKKSRLLQSRGLKENGRSVAFAERHLVGSALVVDGQLVHLSAHLKCLGQSESFESAQPTLKLAKAEWEAAHPYFLRDLEDRCAERHRRYTAFKERLKPPSPTSSPREETRPPQMEEAAARPQPLSPHLHGFFLRLFRRS